MAPPPTTTLMLLMYIVLALNVSVFEMKMLERGVLRDRARRIRLPALVTRVIGHVMCLCVMPRWFVAAVYMGIVLASFF